MIRALTIVTLLVSASLAHADEITLASVPAVIVKTMPEAGTNGIDPQTKEIKITFSKRMLDKSWSWAQMNKETFPEVASQPKYLQDGKTCVLGVKLEPNKTYAIWLNSKQFGNFKDADGRSAVPYLLVFETGN